MAKKIRTSSNPPLSNFSLPVTNEHRMAALGTSEPPHEDKDLEQEIQYIPLSDIFPSPTNPRKHFEEGPLAELAGSISKYGVIQAVTLRPKKGMAGKYELVCGERRWLASQRAEKIKIPATVRDLSDDQVLDLQFTENLQRQDVHPMDEAVTFKAMIETNRYTVADIAAKVIKGEAFVVHRLSLNNLIPAFQEDFWAGKFLIGHAVVFSRLTPADQQECYKYYRHGYDVISTTKDYIDRAINRKLSSAPFKKDDASLVPAAGACTSCSKRSGCNLLLFNDYEKDDRCFDQVCFEKKMKAFLINKVQSTIETKPEIRLIQSSSYGVKLDPAIKKIAADMNVEILDMSSNNVNSYQSSGYVPVKALFVSGNSQGKIETIYIKGKEKASTKDGEPGKRTHKVIDEEIAAIEGRQARALELDAEKAWIEVRKLLEDPGCLDQPMFSSETTTQEERNAMAYALLEAIKQDEYQSVAWKLMKINTDEELYYFLEREDVEKIQKTTMAQLCGLLRLFILEKLQVGSSPVGSDGPFMLMPVLKSPKYLNSEIAEIENAQKEAIEKRVTNAAKRLQKLKDEKAALPAPKEKTQKKPDPKKDKKAISKGIKSLLEKKVSDDDPDDE
jgi:ParB/RepB/Spo0J family partition protein